MSWFTGMEDAFFVIISSPRKLRQEFYYCIHAAWRMTLSIHFRALPRIFIKDVEDGIQFMGHTQRGGPAT